MSRKRIKTGCGILRARRNPVPVDGKRIRKRRKQERDIERPKCRQSLKVLNMFKAHYLGQLLDILAVY